MPRPLPFRLASADIPLILVPTSLNGQGPYHFMIDTGNGESEPILFRPVAAALGLTLHSEAELPGVSGPVWSARARLDRLDVGQTSLTDEEVLVIDELGLPPVDVRPAGILGHGFFRDCRLVIDYPAHTLEFAASQASRAADTPFSLGTPKPFVIVEARVEEGPAAAGAAVVSRLEAAGRTERDAPVAVIDLFGPVSQAAGRPIDGILGYPFLRSCRVEIDYPACRLLLAPPEPGQE